MMTRAKGPLYNVHFRRRREGRTNYARRLALLKSRLPRLVIRKSNKAIVSQIVEFHPSGDKVVCQASTMQLSIFGFNAKRNTPSGYLLGFLIARKALAKSVEKVVPDIGLHTASKGSVLFAVLKGAIDAGLKIEADQNMFPSQDRITGKHISADISNALEKIKSIDKV